MVLWLRISISHPWDFRYIPILSYVFWYLKNRVYQQKNAGNWNSVVLFEQISRYFSGNTGDIPHEGLLPGVSASVNSGMGKFLCRRWCQNFPEDEPIYTLEIQDGFGTWRHICKGDTFSKVWWYDMVSISNFRVCRQIFLKWVSQPL